MSGLTYRGVGVDLERKQEALRRVRERVARTRRPEVLGDIGSFAGLFRLSTSYQDPVLVATTDGVGTKIELARRLDRHEVVGTDLVHQSVNDALAMGAEPLFFLDYFATSRIDPAVFARIVGAMADACAANGCALLGGETAEMPGTYAEGSYDLAGFLVGVVEREKMLDPASVREGDVLIGLPSTGLHTNGYTLARAVVARAAGAGDGGAARSGDGGAARSGDGGAAGSHDGGAASDDATLEVLRLPRPELRGGSLGEALLEPHRSYLADVRRIREAARIRSIAHITGGGSWEGNLPRALPDGLGAVVERSSWTVPPVFKLLADLGGVDRDEQWRTWNMGIGLVVVVPAEDEWAVTRTLPDAIVIGRVESARGDRRVRWAQ